MKNIGYTVTLGTLIGTCFAKLCERRATKHLNDAHAEFVRLQDGDPNKFVYRPYKHHLPSFINRLAAAVLYPESNAQSRDEYGKHYILFPKLQPGAIEKQMARHHQYQMNARSVFETMRRNEGADL